MPNKRKLSKPMKRKRVTKRPRPDTSDSDDSDSTSPTVLQTEENALWSIPDTTTKLPEELLQSLYKPPGVLMIAGMVSWDLVGKRENNANNRTHPNLYTFHKFTERRYRFIASSCSAGHSVLIDENGAAYTFGRNPCGQLGLGDTVTRDVPTLVPALEGSNVIHAAVGKNHTLFVTDTGTVYSCGDNKSGQCGIGSLATQTVLTPMHVRHTGVPIVKVGCGADFSMILDCSGALHSFGLPEYGQLGHNTDGKYFVTSTRLSFFYETSPKHITLFFQKINQGLYPVKDVEIVDFSCGNNHTVAIDSKKRAFSWGFGGFGRLGHAEPRDEIVPRMIKFFETQVRGLRAVYCGSTYSLAVNEIGTLFMFGQTKRTGEANMYPKVVHDLTGWNVRCVGTGNTSIVMAADDALISWGVSPTYGELGTGEINKSTTHPREVARMENLKITQVTMGFSHTLLLVDDSTEEVKKILDTKPVFKA